MLEDEADLWDSWIAMAGDRRRDGTKVTTSTGIRNGLLKIAYSDSQFYDLLLGKPCDQLCTLINASELHQEVRSANSPS